MRAEVPILIEQLLAAVDGPAKDEAWDRLIREHSDLLLRVARLLGGGHDASMDRYTHVIDHLRRDDFRRLRGYVPSPHARFTTWLVVVARRLCLDHMRLRYGRTRAEGALARGAAGTRRRLSDLVTQDLDDVRDVPDQDEEHPLARLAVRHSAACLQSAIDALDPDDRLLLKLRFEDDLPAREIAMLMHLPTLFHAYRRLNSVLARLRSAMEKAGVEDSSG
jgi:RNA polymerase sigma factor (sigma-70 family)